MGLLREFHEEIEVDLLGMKVDLLDFYRGTLTPRRLELLLRNLPATSLLLRKARPELAQLQWTPAEFLAADIFDLFAAAHFKDPKPYPRPAEQLKAWQSRQQRIAALEAQAERNRLRDEAEARALAAERLA